MPNRTIYIRADDLEAWDRIKDKPEFVHDAIQASVPYKDGRLPFTTMQFKEDVATLGKVIETGKKLQSQVEDMAGQVTEPIQPVILKDNEQVKGFVKSLPKKPTIEYCQHGNVKGLCKKGCK